MIGRISTAGQHNAAVQQMQKQQSLLSRTQAQVASGKRIQTPADDPIASTRILANERTQAQLDQYGRNADMAIQRLGYGEQALADVDTLMQRIRELAVQAGSGSMDNSALTAIASEVRARAAEMQQIANRQDANGEYLFAGYSTTTRPFASGAGSVSYAGDQGARQAQISATQQIADGFNGQRVFMDVPEGNGTFDVVAGTQTGTGIISLTQVYDGSAWATAAAAAAAVPRAHAYTISFTDADSNGIADTFRVVDSGGTQVATGSYSSDTTISFDGVRITLTGSPSVGDTFQVTPAGRESIFATITDLAALLERGAASPTARAQLNTGLNRAMSQLDTAMNHFGDLRAEAGARLSALDAAQGQRDELQYQLDESIGALRDLDYAEAIARMNQQLVGLQAAQAAYTRIGQMSLFDYL